MSNEREDPTTARFRYLVEKKHLLQQAKSDDPNRVSILAELERDLAEIGHAWQLDREELREAQERTLGEIEEASHNRPLPATKTRSRYRPLLHLFLWMICFGSVVLGATHGLERCVYLPIAAGYCEEQGLKFEGFLIVRRNHYVGSRCSRTTVEGRFEQVDIERGYLVDNATLDSVIRGAITLVAIGAALVLPIVVMFKIAGRKRRPPRDHARGA